MRTYTDTERDHFAAYVDIRAEVRPAECHGGLDCWVEFGPPAMNTYKCAGCGGSPVIPVGFRGKTR